MAKQTIKRFDFGRVSSSKEPELAKMVNQMAEILETMPVPTDYKQGYGIRLVEDGDTTIIESRRQFPKETKWYPFKLFQQKPEVEPLKVSVYYGTVNNVVPTIDDIEIHKKIAEEVPKLTAPADEGEYIIYLKFFPADCEASGHDEEEAIIELAEALPEDTATVGHIEIGRLAVENQKICQIFQSVTHSLQHFHCGETHKFWGI